MRDHYILQRVCFNLTPIDENFNNTSGHIVKDNGIQQLLSDSNDLASLLEQLQLAQQDLKDEGDKSTIIVIIY